MLKSLQRMAERHPGHVIAVVSHEMPIRLLIARIAGLSGPEAWDLPLPTGMVAHLAFQEGTFSLPRPRPVLLSHPWRDVQTRVGPEARS
jgi:broad specificity phosphatase PhoE